MIGEKKEAAKKGKKLELDNEELVEELNGLFTDAMLIETDVSLMKNLRGKGRRGKDVKEKHNRQ